MNLTVGVCRIVASDHKHISAITQHTARISNHPSPIEVLGEDLLRLRGRRDELEAVLVGQDEHAGGVAVALHVRSEVQLAQRSRTLGKGIVKPRQDRLGECG